jgi:hypothetical protein
MFSRFRYCVFNYFIKILWFLYGCPIFTYVCIIIQIDGLGDVTLIIMFYCSLCLRFQNLKSVSC